MQNSTKPITELAVAGEDSLKPNARTFAPSEEPATLLPEVAEIVSKLKELINALRRQSLAG